MMAPNDGDDKRPEPWWFNELTRQEWVERAHVCRVVRVVLVVTLERVPLGVEP